MVAVTFLVRELGWGRDVGVQRVRIHFYLRLAGFSLSRNPEICTVAVPFLVGGLRWGRDTGVQRVPRDGSEAQSRSTRPPPSQVSYRI